MLEISVQVYSELENKKIKDILWPENCLVVSINRGEKEILPKGDTIICAGDLLIIMTNENNSKDLLKDISEMAATS